MKSARVIRSVDAREVHSCNVSETERMLLSDYKANVTCDTTTEVRTKF